MNRPNKCKWCGAGVGPEPLSLLFIRYECRSSFWIQPNEWQMSQGCAFVAANQVDQYRDRIQRALDELRAATRFELVRDEHGAYMKGRNSWGNWLDVIEIEKVVKILEGENDEQTE